MRRGYYRLRESNRQACESWNEPERWVKLARQRRLGHGEGWDMEKKVAARTKPKQRVSLTRRNGTWYPVVRTHVGWT